MQFCWLNRTLQIVSIRFDLFFCIQSSKYTNRSNGSCSDNGRITCMQFIDLRISRTPLCFCCDSRSIFAKRASYHLWLTARRIGLTIYANPLTLFILCESCLFVFSFRDVVFRRSVRSHRFRLHLLGLLRRKTAFDECIFGVCVRPRVNEL